MPRGDNSLEVGVRLIAFWVSRTFWFCSKLEMNKIRLIMELIVLGFVGRRRRVVSYERASFATDNGNGALYAFYVSCIDSFSL